MNEPPTRPRPEGDELELEPVAVSQGTTADDWNRVDEGRRLRRTLSVVAAVIFVGLSALVFVFLVGTEKVGHEVDHLGNEAGRLLDKASAAASGEKAPIIDPGESIVTQTLEPTGRTIPGMVYIDSIPSDASVAIEGEHIGQTPLMVGRSYATDFVQVKVQKKGYQTWNGTVQVVEGGVRVDVTLEPR